MRSPKAPRRRAVIFRSHGLLQIIQGTLRFPCAGCRQLPFCGLAARKHLALQAVPVQQVLSVELSKKICTTPAYIQQDRTDFIINPFTRTVSHKTGNIIQLTAKEFDILYFLISHKEQVFTKEQIYENVWGYDYPADPNNLTSFIRKLRKKIEPEPDRPRYIVIVRGVGYKYTENEEMVGKTATPPE